MRNAGFAPAGNMWVVLGFFCSDLYVQKGADPAGHNGDNKI